MFKGLRSRVLSFKSRVEAYLKFNVLSGCRCLKKGSMQRTQKPDTLDPKILNPKTQNPKTLNPITINQGSAGDRLFHSGSADYITQSTLQLPERSNELQQTSPACAPASLECAAAAMPLSAQLEHPKSCHEAV